MRWPWPVGKVVGVVSLVLFLGVATLARVDAARHPEREWTPSLAGLGNPAAAVLPDVALHPVPIDEDGRSLTVALGTGLSNSGDVAVITLAELPPKLVVVLDGADAKGHVSWESTRSEYSLASFDANGRLAAIVRYPKRVAGGEITFTLVLRDGGALNVWVGSDRIGEFELGPVSALTLKPAEQLNGAEAELGQVQP